MKLTVIVFFFCFLTDIHSQGTWDTLNDLKTEEKYNKELGITIQCPVFSQRVKRMDGSVICLTGFVMDITNKYIYLVKQKTSINITCGRLQMNPSEVVELKNYVYKGRQKIKIGQKIKAYGFLSLSNDMVNFVPYALIKPNIEFIP